MMIAARGAPLPRVGKRRASETTKPFDSEASEVTRASQFIQPVSNPTKSPNAVRAYRYAPPGSLNWLAASAKQSTRMNTGTANSSGANNENGPRSLYDSVGRRKTPLPMTALMHMATRPQKPTALTSLAVCSLIVGMQNSECRVQNDLSAAQFCILHFAFCTHGRNPLPRNT